MTSEGRIFLGRVIVRLAAAAGECNAVEPLDKLRFESVVTAWLLIEMIRKLGKAKQHEQHIN